MADEEESSPGTAAFVPDFDTGEQSQPLETPAVEHPSTDELSAVRATQHSDLPDLTAIAGQPGDGLPPAVQPVTVPGRYYYLKWWKFLLVLVAVWIVAAAVGMVLFSWWFHADNKTPVLFAVLVYTVASTVGALMLAMIPGHPLLAALAIAVSSAVFASLIAVAPLYGHYRCERAQHCIADMLPY